MKIVYLIAKYLQYVAAAALVLLMMLQVVNMVGRVLFSSPLPGATDLGSYTLLVVVAMGLGWAALEGRHIKVGLFMDRLPWKVQFVIDSIMLLVVLCVVVYVAYLNILAGATWPPRVSSVLRVPLNPLRILLGVGFSVLSLCTVVVMIDHFRSWTKRGRHES